MVLFFQWSAVPRGVHHNVRRSLGVNGAAMNRRANSSAARAVQISFDVEIFTLKLVHRNSIIYKALAPRFLERFAVPFFRRNL